MAGPRYSIVFRPNNEVFENSLKETRECIAESIRVLRSNEPPDTFLGRNSRNIAACSSPQNYSAPDQKLA
jgi:hypothetical protein